MSYCPRLELAYQTKHNNLFKYQVRIAELLGVAGTDVPIAEIEKLIPPYKVSMNTFKLGA